MRRIVALWLSFVIGLSVMSFEAAAQPLVSPFESPVKVLARMEMKEVKVKERERVTRGWYVPMVLVR